MQTVRAVDANRQFSYVLKQVAQGEEFLVVSRGKPVATIAPVRKSDNAQLAARQELLARLAGQEATGTRTWCRDELYGRLGVSQLYTHHQSTPSPCGRGAGGGGNCPNLR